MILFIISLILICMSSYLITSLVVGKSGSFQKGAVAFNVLFITAFAQIVGSLEVLSLFKSINKFGILSINILFSLAVLFVFFKYSNKKLFFPVLLRESEKIKKALFRDKFLAFYSICFLFFIFISLFLAFVSGVNVPDSLCYHLNRAAFFVSNGTLLHFDIADVRNLEMPINSEILYAWVMAFFKEDMFLGIFSYVSFFVAIFSLYNLLGALSFSTRKKLWSVFLFSSIASVVVETTSTETNLMLGALVLSSVYFFLVGVKQNKKVLLFYSALSYSLAIGVKTPAIMAMPSVFLILGTITYLYGKKYYKNIIKNYLVYFVINILLFAAFNYVLNFIQFGNVMGAKASLYYHSMQDGFGGGLANFIKHSFSLIDFSGFTCFESISKNIIKLQNFIISVFIGQTPNAGTTIFEKTIVNNSLFDQTVGLGLLGFIAFLPAFIGSGLYLFKKNKSKTQTFLSMMAFAFILNMLILSFSMIYIVYSVRFITFL